MNIKKEVNESLLLMNDNTYILNHNHYNNIDKIMTLGGDNFKELCEKIDIQGKRAYCVSGSLDQSLELVLNGFTFIDCFDINILSVHIFNLKIAAIKALTYNEFMEFSKKLFLDSSIYEKIIPFLKKETKKYLELLFAQKSQEYIFNNLFTHKYFCGSKIIDSCMKNFSFYNEKEYYLLKQKIMKAKLVFRHQDLLQITNLSTKYDFMYFSNILLFQHQDLKKFKEQVLPVCLKHLNDNGMIVVCYLHHYLEAKNKIDVKDKQAQKINNIIFNEFLDCIDDKVVLDSSDFGHGTGTKDMALILTKK